MEIKPASSACKRNLKASWLWAVTWNYLLGSAESSQDKDREEAWWVTVPPSLQPPPQSPQCLVQQNFNSKWKQVLCIGAKTISVRHFTPTQGCLWQTDGHRNAWFHFSFTCATWNTSHFPDFLHLISLSRTFQSMYSLPKAGQKVSSSLTLCHNACIITSLDLIT